MKNVYILILLLCVMLPSAIMFFALYKYNKHDFDEMQEIARGKAAKLTFLITMSLCGAYYLYDLFAGDNLLRLSGSTLALLVLGVGLAVFSSYCIMHDAYFYVGTKDGLKSSCKINIFICIICILSLTMYSPKDLFDIKDGIIGLSGVSCFTPFILSIYVIDTITFFLKIRQEKVIESFEE